MPSPQILFSPILTARILIILDLIASIRGYALSSFIEVLLVVIFITSAKLRSRIYRKRRQLCVIFIFPFYIILAELIFHSDFYGALYSLNEWRKWILIPMTLAVFTAKDYPLVPKVFVLVTCVYALFISGLEIFGIPVFTERGSSNLMQNHSIQGFFLVLSAVFLLVWANKQPSLRLKTIYIIVTGWLIYLAIDVTTGRTGFLLLLITPVFMVLAAGVRVSKVFLMLFTINVAAMAMSDNARDRIMSGINEFVSAFDAESDIAAESMAVRRVMWGATLELILDHPVGGTGSTEFKKTYGKYVGDLDGWRANEVDDPHNQYLLVAGRYGLLGLSAFLVILGIGLFKSFRLRATHPEYFCLLMAMTALGFFNGIFGSFVLGRWAMVILGFVYLKMYRRHC